MVSLRTSLLCLSLLFLSASVINAHDSVTLRVINSEWVQGGQLMSEGNRLILAPDELVDRGKMQIPRFYARMKKLVWQLDGSTSGLKLVPEPDYWVVSWQDVPDGAQSIVLELADLPRIQSQRQPIVARSDGGFRLDACQAATHGEKLRYEPQPHKNTVGYWTIADDWADWELQVEKPGAFNVAILQGCGAEQGGSQVEMRLSQNDQLIADLSFDVKETGHFQDFQWRHLGTIEISEAGRTRLSLHATKLANKAVMDCRAIELVRLPE